MADVAAANRGLYDELKELSGCNMTMPTIAGDSNNITQMVARKTATKSSTVAAFYNNWGHCGIKVYPVVDGPIRPTCKQATIERKAGLEKSRIKGFILMKEANDIKKNIAQGLVPSNQLAEVNEKLSSMEKDSRSKIAASEDLMPEDFAEALEDALVNDWNANVPNASGGFVASVLLSKFQADAVIVQLFISMMIIMAITRDSDIPILAGDGFVAVKDYTKDGK